jgi:hypothetical protein
VSTPTSPGLDLDGIEARAQYVHATTTGRPYALADDARELVAEVRRLRADLASAQQLAADYNDEIIAAHSDRLLAGDTTGGDE